MGASDWEKEIARLDGRVNTVEARLETHIEASGRVWEEDKADHKSFRELANRPSWAMSLGFSALVGLCASLLTYIATH